ncbi:MAG: DUF1549 domain-containing protein [Planctomycetia bacterium]|nr:DUF1549 domain-containing protein [Planctomycetia bacterium]
MNLKLTLRAALLALACAGLAGSLQAAEPKLPGKLIIDAKPFIDQLLENQWKEEKLTAAPRTSDAEFMRRVCLDITGQVPLPHEVRVFEEDPSPDKRPRLIDRLLESDDYAQHWANLWTQWLMAGPLPEPAHRERFRDWLRGQLADEVSHKELTKKLLTATGKAQENPATLFLRSHLGLEQPKNRWGNEGRFNVEPATWRTTRAFLGIQVSCIRCHDHPWNANLKQKDFWGLNVFYRQLDVTADGAQVDNPQLNRNGLIFYEKRNGVFVPPIAAFLDGRQLRHFQGPNDTRRDVLAEFVVTAQNFAPALVNRYWGQFFGRGLNLWPAVDDFGNNNVVVHPELLHRLSAEFATNGHNYKKLIRWICNSQAYQLQSVSNASNLSPDTEVWLSRMPLKELKPEQRLNALLRALRADETLTPAEQRQFRQRWRATMERPEVSDEMDYNICVQWQTVPVHFEAALVMHFDRDIIRMLEHRRGVVAQAVQAGKVATVLDELYLAALNRRPTARETAWIERELAKAKPEEVTAFWQDVFFVLLNSSEFIFNR